MRIKNQGPTLISSLPRSRKETKAFSSSNIKYDQNNNYELTRNGYQSRKINETSKVDVDPGSFEFIHDKPHLPRQSK